MEKELFDIEYEEKRIAEELEDIAISVEDGKVEFAHVDHSRRAGRFGRISDGNTTEYANIALEYFGNRCALSGEKFETFELEDSKYKTNLSAEHIVALAIGGHDIAPNIVPSVLQYNVRKNGYYILDYWSKQKDNNGKPIYSPYRLLKVVNYMLKSIEARKSAAVGNIESYRQAILTPNAIDDLLTKIEEQDVKETDNSKRQILSSTITTTTLDEDNKKILTIVPNLDKDIPDQHEQAERENDYREMMESFISDSIGVIGRELPHEQIAREDGTQATLSQELQSMFERVVDTIPLEVQIRKTIIDTLEQQGIENVYTITNEYVYNSSVLAKTREMSQEERQEYVAKQITQRIQELNNVLTEEEIETFISSIPHVLYDEGIVDRLKLWKKLDIEAPDVDVRNRDFALKIAREYPFEETLGRTLTQQEEKAIVQSLIRIRELNKNNGYYISTLYNKLVSAGLEEKEAYGAIINYAIGIGNGNYSYALGGTIKYTPETIAKIKKDITADTIKEALLNNDMEIPENTAKLQELGIEAGEVRFRNIDFALKILKEYPFEETLGKSLTQGEEKAIVQSLIKCRSLNRNKSIYISTLHDKLVSVGLEEKEAYGAIINYAIGNGNYSGVLNGKIKYTPETIAKIKKDITADTIKEALLNNDMEIPENTAKLQELGIEAGEVRFRNIDFALKILKEYPFEETLGKSLTQGEEKAIVQSLIRNSLLNKNYISTLYDKLISAGLEEKEAYGAIINYAIGNGNYTDALGGTIKYTPGTITEVKKDITSDTIKEALLNNDMEIPENTAKLHELGIEAGEVHSRNIDFALKIVREYSFEETLGRALTQGEEKALVQSLIRNSKLNKNNSKYISTLHDKLFSAGLEEKDAYGAIINYAIGTGDGDYSSALGGRIKYTPETIAEVKKDITAEDITKVVIKQQKKAAKLAKSTVTKETIQNIDDTLTAIDEMTVTKEMNYTSKE